jgi:Tfp pilus assembly protein PilO
MNKLTKEKKQQLILIGLGTVAAVVAIWFLLISAQTAKINDIKVKIAGTEKEVAKRRMAKKQATVVEDELAQSQRSLCQIESAMPAGPPFEWVNRTLRRFNQASYKIDMQTPGVPAEGEVAMLPDFPYHQLDVSVQGTGFYYDIGKFIAEFENHFPCMRIQNLSLTPATAEEQEKLTFRMEIIILTKADNT